MQSDKVKETLWTIHTRGKSQKIELRYKELMGDIQSIKFKISNDDNTASLEMAPSEFQKIYLIFQSFHDLLTSSDDMNNVEKSSLPHTLPKEKDDEDLFGNREINTNEWEPW